MTLTSITTKRLILIIIGYLLVVSGLKLLVRGPISVLHLQSLTFSIGLLLGTQISVVDKIIYAFFTAPETDFARHIQGLVKKKNIFELLSYLSKHNVSTYRLATNNVLFLGIWSILGLFIITSSPNNFAKGIILGIGLILSLELYRDLKDIDALKSRLFWPVSRPFNTQETKTLLYFFWGVFGVLSFLFI